MKVTAEQIEQFRKEIRCLVDEKYKQFISTIEIRFEAPIEWAKGTWTQVVELPKRIGAYTCMLAFMGTILTAVILMPDETLNSFGEGHRLIPNNEAVAKTLRTFYYDEAALGLPIKRNRVEPDEAADFVEIVYPSPVYIQATGSLNPVQRLFLPYSGVSGVSNLQDYYRYRG